CQCPINEKVTQAAQPAIQTAPIGKDMVVSHRSLTQRAVPILESCPAGAAFGAANGASWDSGGAFSAIGDAAYKAGQGFYSKFNEMAPSYSTTVAGALLVWWMANRYFNSSGVTVINNIAPAPVTVNLTLQVNGAPVGTQPTVSTSKDGV